MGFFSDLFSWTRTGQDYGAEIAARQNPQAFGEFKPLTIDGIADIIGGRGHVNDRRALHNSTLFRAVNLISGVMGALPTNLMAKRPDGSPVKMSQHPAHRLMRGSPNPVRRQSPLAFKSYMQGRALLTGNAYALIAPGMAGPQALIQMDPTRVDVRARDDGGLDYLYRPVRGGEKVYGRHQIFHLRAPWSSDGVTGDGLLKVAGDALNLADDASEAARRLLRNGAYVGGTLQHPKHLSSEAIIRLQNQFVDRFQGPENAGRWMVLEEGLEAKPLGATGRDAQGIEQRKLQIEEIARFTGVPRPLLMVDETSWGSGIEQLGLYFVIYCLTPWIVAWEEELAAVLLTDQEREDHYFKFNEAALLRGSLKDQAEYLSKMLGGPGQTGAMVPNEAREKLDLPPSDGGDRPYWGQMEGSSDGTS